jgi:hypothetical protein
MVALAPAGEAHAQAPGDGYARPGVAIGAMIGAGGAPAALHYSCDQETTGRVAAASVGARLRLSMGRVRLESQTVASDEVTMHDCLLILPIPTDGTHARRFVETPRTAMTSTDLRLGYHVPTRIPLVVTTGLGWSWSHHIPFWGASMGTHTSGRGRLHANLYWEQYRIPIHLRIEEWRHGQTVRILAQTRSHEWHGGWGVRLGAELALR